VIDEFRVKASKVQTERLRSWASKFDDRVWAVESARGLGSLLSQQLVAAGERVIDVPAVLSTRTRLLGSGRSQKNDPNDACSVAITALRNQSLRVVTRDDHAQVLTLLAKRHRDLGRLRNKTICRVSRAADGWELLPGGMTAEMTVNRALVLLKSVDPADAMDRHPSFAFYRDGLGLEALGPLADDGFPEPSQFRPGLSVSLMLIPTGGFGWVAGECRVAPSGANECVLCVYAPDETPCGIATSPPSPLAAPASTSPYSSHGTRSQPRSTTPDGHLWMILVQPPDWAI
jgi:Transposase